LRRSSLPPKDVNARYRTIQDRHRFKRHHPIVAMTMRRKALHFSDLLRWRCPKLFKGRDANSERSDLHLPRGCMPNKPMRKSHGLKDETAYTSLAYHAGLRRARAAEQWSKAELRRSSLRPEGVNARYRTIQDRHRFKRHHPIVAMTMRRKALHFSDLLRWCCQELFKGDEANNERSGLHLLSDFSRSTIQFGSFMAQTGRLVSRQ